MKEKDKILTEHKKQLEEIEGDNGKQLRDLKYKCWQLEIANSNLEDECKDFDDRNEILEEQIKSEEEKNMLQTSLLKLANKKIEISSRKQRTSSPSKSPRKQKNANH